MDDSHRRRALGDAVIRRRRQLGYSQEDLVKHGGPSHQTIRTIEQGRPDAAFRPSTLAKLDTSLHWRPGTVQAILDGTATQARLSEVVVYNSGQDSATMTESATVTEIPAAEADLGGLEVVASWPSDSPFVRDHPIKLRGRNPDPQQQLKDTTEAVGAALFQYLLGAGDAPRVAQARRLVNEAWNLLLAENDDPGGDLT